MLRRRNNTDRALDLVQPGAALTGRFCALIVCAALLVTDMRAASGQDYPNKPIRIVTSSLGMGVDVASRIIAPRLAEGLGQPVVIVNMAAGGPAAGAMVARAPGDGYTLVVGGSTFVLLGALQDSLSWDPARDFAPISLMASAPNVLLVHPSLPVRSVSELVALARSRPRVLHFGAGGSATPNRLAGELFRVMARVDIGSTVHKTNAQALNALVGGGVELGFASASLGMSQVKSGRLRGLAVTSTEPTELAPGFQTIAASGLPGYESVSIYGMLAPVATPVEIIERLHQEIVRALKMPDVKQQFFRFGADTSGISPRQYAAKISAELAVMGKVIRDAGIRGE